MDTEVAAQIVTVIVFVLIGLIFFLAIMPGHVRRSLAIDGSNKRKAVVLKKEIEPDTEIDETEYCAVYVSVDGREEKYYCGSSESFDEIPIGQELIIYVSGKSIVHFEQEG